MIDHNVNRKPLYWICIQWSFVYLRRYTSTSWWKCVPFSIVIGNHINQTWWQDAAILAGDMDIDLIKYTLESVASFISTMISYRYLPYITLPTRITQFSATSIDHISMKQSNKENVLSTLYGMFYCDISDHLPCFISLQYANNSLYKRMTNDWNIWRQKLFQVCKNWNDKYMDTENEWYHRFVNTVHQISEQSFPLVQPSRQLIKDNPWITKFSKINIMHINKLYNSQLFRPVRQQTGI